MFCALFDLVTQLTESSPQFKHIHGTGWSCVVGDLDYAQAKALGLVLNEMDATKNWEEHLINVFKSCRVHYKRYIYINLLLKSIVYINIFYFLCRKIHERRYDDILANDMLALLTATSEVEINNLFNKIEVKEPG
jgi:hypothetical protein